MFWWILSSLSILENRAQKSEWLYRKLERGHARQNYGTLLQNRPCVTCKARPSCKQIFYCLIFEVPLCYLWRTLFFSGESWGKRSCNSLRSSGKCWEISGNFCPSWGVLNRVGVDGVGGMLPLFGNFGPEKKKNLAPPPPPNSSQTPSRTLGLPSPTRPGDPPPGIFSKNLFPPPPGASDSPFPSPEQKKNKKYPKRPPRLPLFFSLFFFVFFRYSSLFSYCPRGQGQTIAIHCKVGHSLRPRLHPPRAKLPDLQKPFLLEFVSESPWSGIHEEKLSLAFKLQRITWTWWCPSKLVSASIRASWVKLPSRRTKATPFENHEYRWRKSKVHSFWGGGGGHSFSIACS